MKRSKKFIYLLSACLGLLPAQWTNAQTAAADNIISESNIYNDLPSGPAVYSIFEGRTPYIDLRPRIVYKMTRDCDHLKWRIVLFRDPATQQPTTFTQSMVTDTLAQQVLKGKWRIVHPAAAESSPAVVELDYDLPGKSLYLQKGDENVLFILDDNRAFRTGDQYYSYTLNRVRFVRRSPDR